MKKKLNSSVTLLCFFFIKYKKVKKVQILKELTIEGFDFDFIYNPSSQPDFVDL